MDKVFEQDIDYTNLDIKLRKNKGSVFDTKSRGGLVRLVIFVIGFIIIMILAIMLISRSRIITHLNHELNDLTRSVKITRDERARMAKELTVLREENNNISNSIIELSQSKMQLMNALKELEKEDEELSKSVIGYNEDFMLNDKELKDIMLKNDGLTNEIKQLKILNEGFEKQIHELSKSSSSL